MSSSLRHRRILISCAIGGPSATMSIKVPAPLFSPYVAAFLVAANRHVLDIDRRSASFLQSSSVLGIRNNRVSALDNEFNEQLVHAGAARFVDGDWYATGGLLSSAAKGGPRPKPSFDAFNAQRHVSDFNCLSKSQFTDKFSARLCENTRTVYSN